MSSGAVVITLLLGIVAFFLRNLISQVQELITKVAVVEERITNNHYEIFNRLNKVEDRVTRLESSQT